MESMEDIVVGRIDDSKDSQQVSVLKRSRIIREGHPGSSTASASAAVTLNHADDDDDEDGFSTTRMDPSTKKSTPMKGCMVTVHYIARQGKDRTKIISASRSMDPSTKKSIGGDDVPIRFELLRFDDEEDDEYAEDETVNIARGIPRAMHFAVSRMMVGEISEFYVLHPSLGWSAVSPRGRGRALYCKPELESAMVNEGFSPVSILEIELVSFDPPLPKFPSNKSLEKSREQWEQEERKRARDYPPPTAAERVKNAEEAKKKGNEYFKKGEYENALEKYVTAFVHVFYTAEDWEKVESKEDRRIVQECRRVLHLNRSMCKIKMLMFEDAEWDCDKAIEISEEVYGKQVDPRPFYRRGLVYVEKLKATLRLEKEKKFWDLDRANEMRQHAIDDVNTAKELIAEARKANANGSGKGDEDSGIRSLEKEIEVCGKWLKAYEQQQRAKQRVMVQEKMFKDLRASGQSAPKPPPTQISLKKNENVDDEDLPELED